MKRRISTRHAVETAIESSKNLHRTWAEVIEIMKREERLAEKVRAEEQIREGIEACSEKRR